MKLVRKEKKLDGFSVIYLHDTTKCKRCIAIEEYSNMVNSCVKNINPYDENKKKVFKVMNPYFGASPSRLTSKGSGLKFLVSLESVEKRTKPTKAIKLVRKKNLNNISPTPESSVKQQVKSPKKTDGAKKQPGKGTLKRKRWFFDKMKQSNDNYEDDIFENKKFGHFKNLLEDDTDGSDKYEELKTPEFPISISSRENTPSPSYRDCYSPTELSISRKGVEEYNYRKGKRKLVPDAQKPVPEGSEKKKIQRKREDFDIHETLRRVAGILSERTKQIQTESENEEDHYFSDDN